MSDADVVRPVLERALRRVANATAPVDDALLRQIRADLVEALDLLASGRAPSLQELWASDPQAARERERRAIEKHASASTKSSAAAAPPCRSRALAANGEIVVCGSTDRGHRCRLTSDEYVLLFKDFDKERLAKEAAARAERRKRQRQNQENVGPAQNST